MLWEFGTGKYAYSGLSSTISILDHSCNQSSVVDRDRSGSGSTYHSCYYTVIAAATIAVIAIAEGEAEGICLIGGGNRSAKGPHTADRHRAELPAALPEHLEIQGRGGRISEDIAEKFHFHTGFFITFRVHVQIHQRKNRSHLGVRRDGQRAIAAAFELNPIGALAGETPGLKSSGAALGGQVLMFGHNLHSYIELAK